MPWMIRKRKNEWCVFKEGADGEPTGDSRGCHPTEQAAKDQMAALHVHADGDKAASLMDQEMAFGEAVRETAPMPKPEPMMDDAPYMVEVYTDYGIIRRGETYWKVPYTLDENDKVILSPQSEWTQVERQWQPVGKAMAPDLATQFQAKLPQRIPAGNALKTIGKTTTELRVANYMCLFGGRDLEGLASPRVNADGSRGEYFTKATKFTSPYTEVGVLYEDWEHGMAPQDEPGADEPLGIVDWKTAKITDKGLFVERVLNRRNRYVQMLEELIDQGLIGTSSQAIPAGVQKAADGHILAWPLERDTLTVTPMEPRNLTDNQLQAIKRAGERLPALKSIFEAWQTVPEADAIGESGQASGDAANDAVRLSIELDLLSLGQEG